MIRNRADDKEGKLNDLKSELTHLNGLRASNFLDVGCGLGFALSGLNAQWDRYGLEFSKHAAKPASKWAEVFVGSYW
jgi:hypothetical protein